MKWMSKGPDGLHEEEGVVWRSGAEMGWRQDHKRDVTAKWEREEWKGGEKMKKIAQWQWVYVSVNLQAKNYKELFWQLFL